MTPTPPATAVEEMLMPRTGPVNSGSWSQPKASCEFGERKRLMFVSPVVTAPVDSPRPTICTVDKLAITSALRFAFAARTEMSTEVFTVERARFPLENGMLCPNQKFADDPGPCATLPIVFADDPGSSATEPTVIAVVPELMTTPPTRLAEVPATRATEPTVLADEPATSATEPREFAVDPAPSTTPELTATAPARNAVEPLAIVTEPTISAVDPEAS